MVDKARAHNRDTLGQYLYGYDSGLDQRVLDFLDITAETLAQLVSEKDFQNSLKKIGYCSQCGRSSSTIVSLLG